MRRLLHISDVHFGPPHRPIVSAAITDLVVARQPDLVVLSGDLTQRAKLRQFREARRWVDALAAPTLVVPGNHDVPLYRFWERFLAPFWAYGRGFGGELEPTFRDDELLVVGVNTAHGWTFKDGRITRPRLAEIEDLFKAAPRHLLRVVVAHHHLIPPPNFGSQKVLANAREAVETFTDVGVDLVLSGHHHQTYIGSSEEFYPRGGAPVVIVHSGTSTSSRGRGGERERNSCNWIEIDESSMVISHLRWERSLGRFGEHSRHWYPRRHLEPHVLDGLELPLTPSTE